MKLYKQIKNHEYQEHGIYSYIEIHKWSCKENGHLGYIHEMQTGKSAQKVFTKIISGLLVDFTAFYYNRRAF